MMPGGKLTVIETSPSTGVMVIERDGQNVPLGLAVAAKIRVKPKGAQ
jgi:Fe2+ transport system protein FeoA